MKLKTLMGADGIIVMVKNEEDINIINQSYFPRGSRVAGHLIMEQILKYTKNL